MSRIACFPHGLMLICFVALLVQGCTSGKRLGEARMEQRRYSRGWHVNVPHERRSVRVPTPPGQAGEINPVLTASVGGDVPLGDEGALSGEGQERLDGHALSTPDLGRKGAVLPEMECATAPLTDGPPPDACAEPNPDGGLPEPIMGRHPDAVPGFLLSLGWLLGAIGATALEYLLIPAVGFALFLGVAMSVMGYRMSRKAYRMARSHPERYPRNGLSRAARWVAGAPLLAVGLWLALVILFVVLSGWY